MKLGELEINKIFPLVLSCVFVGTALSKTSVRGSGSPMWNDDD